MKRLYVIALALIIVAAALTGCAGSRADNKPTQPVTVTHRATEGATKKPTKPTKPTVQNSTAQSTTKAPKATTSRTVTHTVAPTRASATGRASRLDIPPDDITSRNVNPNISSIAQVMASEINNLAVKGISVGGSEVELKVGESKELTVTFSPENAANKTLTVKTDSKAASAAVSGKTVKITGKSEGTTTVTIISHNGKTASVNVKVTSAVITDDTVLPHGSLCTDENAERWLSEILARGEMMGMTRNPTLSGSTFIIKTSSDRSDASYNEYCDRLVVAAVEQFSAYTGSKYSDYEFNAVIEPADGEYNFIITVVPITD